MKKLTWLLMSLMLFLGMGTAFADVIPPTFTPGDGGKVAPGQAIKVGVDGQYKNANPMILVWTFDQSKAGTLATLEFPGDMNDLQDGKIPGITLSMCMGVAPFVDGDDNREVVMNWMPEIKVPDNAQGQAMLFYRFVVNSTFDATDLEYVTYTVEGEAEPLPTPTFSPAAGPVKEGTEITISGEKQGAMTSYYIAYTIDNKNVDFEQYVGQKVPSAMKYVTAGYNKTSIVINEAKTITAAIYEYNEGDMEVIRFGEKVTVSYEVVTPPAAPVFSPAGGAVPSGTKITLSADKPIYYNIKNTGSEEFDKVKTRADLDKAVKDISGKLKVYPAAGIEITTGRTINAAAIDFDAADNVVWSEVKTEEYTIAVSKPDAPVFSPNGGEVANGVPAITLATTCGDCEIYYVINGSDDDFWPETADDFGLGGSLVYYESPIALTADATIKAAVAQYNDEGEITWSDIETKSFTVTGEAPETIAAPVITPANDAVVRMGTMVTITCATEGAKIYYTTDGTAPYTSGDNGPVAVKESAIEYAAPFELTESMLRKVGEVYELRIRAVAAKGDLISTGVGVGYVVYPNAPQFSPVAGVVEKGTKVTITCEPSQAVIYYTTNGTIPSEEESTPYTEPIEITEAMTLKAVAVLGQYQTSASAVYKIEGEAEAVTLSFNPASGSEVEENTAVTITASDADVDIFYMMFESEEAAKAAEWDQEQAELYSNEMQPVLSAEKTTVKAAYAYVGAEAVAETFFYATYTVKAQPAIELTFNPAPGSEVAEGTEITVTANREVEILYNLYADKAAADADETFVANAKDLAEDGKPVITKEATYLRCGVFNNGAMQYFDAEYKIKVEDPSANEDLELAGVTVYPNPSNGVFNLELPVAATVEVFMSNGVLYQRLSLNEGNTTLNINRSGIYFLRITGEGRTAIKRVIVR